MVIDINNNCSITAVGLDEVLEGGGALGALGAGAESDTQRRQDGALPAAVLAGDEVDVLAELDVEAGVAHEVLQPDAGDRPRHRRPKN